MYDIKNLKKTRDEDSAEIFFCCFASKKLESRSSDEQEEELK